MTEQLKALPVFPNGYVRQTVCVCEALVPARTMINGEWRLVCMTCGSFPQHWEGPINDPQIDTISDNTTGGRSTPPKVFASTLVEDNKGLRARIAELEDLISDRQSDLDIENGRLKARIAELEGLVAGVQVVGKSGYKYVSTYDEIVEHTIEHCAQVVSRFLIAPDSEIEADRKVRKIIAAIRAQKDKPPSPAGERGQVGWMGGEGP